MPKTFMFGYFFMMKKEIQQETHWIYFFHLKLDILQGDQNGP